MLPGVHSRRPAAVGLRDKLQSLLPMEDDSLTSRRHDVRSLYFIVSHHSMAFRHDHGDTRTPISAGETEIEQGTLTPDSHD